MKEKCPKLWSVQIRKVLGKSWMWLVFIIGSSNHWNDDAWNV